MLDPATGRLHIAAAGHFPSVAATPRRPAALAGMAVGIPIGVADDPPRQASTMQLAPGTVLCSSPTG